MSVAEWLFWWSLVMALCAAAGITVVWRRHRVSDRGDTPKVRTVWQRREGFAEQAEALGVPTSSVMAGVEYPVGVWTVMFTRPEHGSDPYTPVLMNVLKRDQDGVLRAGGMARDTGWLLRDFIPPEGGPVEPR